MVTSVTSIPLFKSPDAMQRGPAAELSITVAQMPSGDIGAAVVIGATTYHVKAEDLGKACNLVLRALSTS